MVSAADMLLFSAVVREGSFTRAARQLGITKQSASERIARLEEGLGVRLLERTTRRLRLTEIGSRYHERCSSIALQIEEANREAQQQQAEPSGLLRVSAPVLYGRRFLSPVISSYMSRFPKVRVEVLLADRRVQLVEDGFDLAIRIGEVSDASLAVRKLGDGHAYYVASPTYVAAPRRLRPQALHDLRCIGMRPIETWQIGEETLKIKPALVINDLELACEAAIAGVGIACLPALVCRAAVDSGRLRVLFDGQPALLRPVSVVFPSRRHLPAKVRVFVDLLSALVEPMQPLHLR